MIDAQGFRPNVGIVIANDHGQLLWARRVGGRDAWQYDDDPESHVWWTQILPEFVAELRAERAALISRATESEAQVKAFQKQARRGGSGAMQEPVARTVR